MDLPINALEAAISTASREELPEIVGALARLEALARMRLHENGRSSKPTVSALDRYLTADEVAKRLSMSPDWVYRHADELGGAKLGGAVRFPERAVARRLRSLQ